MNTEIIVKYPIEGTVLFTDKLNIHYTLSSFVDPKVASIRFTIGDTQIIKSNTDDEVIFENLKEGNYVLYCELLNKYGTPIFGSEKQINFKIFESSLSVDKKITYVLKSTIPDFVKEDYPNFVVFLKAYYEWLYSSNNPFYAMLISEDYKDIDKTPDFFIRYFREQYLKDFPENLTVDKETGNPLNIKTLIKNISDFYSAKGTERSVKFLLKILYDSYSEIYLPKKDIFKSSASEWITRKSIKFSYSNDRVYEIKNKQLFQQVGDNIISTSEIQDIKIYRNKNKKIVEIFYDNIIGEFDFNYQFLVEIDGDIISLSPLKIVSSIDITDGGLNYKINDIVNVYKETELISTLKVSEINSFGAIQELKFVNFGYTQDIDGDYTFSVTSDDGAYATFVANEGYICNYSGFWQNKNSHTNSIKKISDNKRYQNFSYVIRTDRNLNRYIEPLKKLVHPAGVEVIGDILLQKELNQIVTYTDNLLNYYTPLIGNYIAYRLNTDINIRQDTDGLDLFPNGFDPTSPIPPQNGSDFEHEVGTDDAISENVSDLVFKYIPDVSDSDRVNDYWVVYPHPNLTINNHTDSNFLNIRLLDFVKQQRD